MERTRKPKADEIEVHPDAWERFGKAVDKVMRSPPKPRPAKKDHGKPSPARRGKRGGSKPT